MIIIKKLPIELKLEILSYLPLITFIKILKDRKIFSALFNRKYPAISNIIANAFFSNIFGLCYLCKCDLNYHYYLNLCFQCSIFIEKEQYFYKICNKCSKKSSKKLNIYECTFCKTNCMYLKTTTYLS